MALGSLISIKKKLSNKDLSWVADLGWLVAIVAMYLLALYLVIGEKLAIKPIFVLIGVAFALVVLFGGMAPDRTFAQGLKAGLADAFTVFLNTISCFGNVMSYIRLFAVVWQDLPFLRVSTELQPDSTDHLSSLVLWLY